MPLAGIAPEGEPFGLTIVMPVYNELATLRHALDRLLAVDMPVPTEVLVVDDGSTDGCLDTIDDLESSDGKVRLVRQPRNPARASRSAAGHRRGLERATSRILDADLEYDPADFVRRCWRRSLERRRPTSCTAPATYGGHAAYSFWYVIGNKALAMWASLLFDAWLTDIETCLKVAPTELWRKVDLELERLRHRGRGHGQVALDGRAHLRGRRSRYKARGREEGKKIQWTDGVGRAVDPAQDPSPEALTRRRRGCRP